MIVDFTVENFRSIKTEQLLSLYADKKPQHHAGNITYSEDSLGILKSCGIYGPNAAGKTNVILAIEALQYLICESGDLKDGDPIKVYQPYLLSLATRDRDTRFEIEFYVENIRYSYHVRYNRHEIRFEKLDFYPSSRPANLFTRHSPTDYKAVKFGDHYKGGRKQVAFFANNTYLAKAGNTADAPEIIRNIFNYFRHNIMVLLKEQTIIVTDWHKDENLKNTINRFLAHADLGITRFEHETKALDEAMPFPAAMPQKLKQLLLEQASHQDVFYHLADNGEQIRFEESLESSGTLRLFTLLPFFLSVLKRGDVIFIDEIEASFHPHIAALIIKLFNDPLVNQKNAQLIFTTHDLSLMSPATMRKDQVYLTEKTVMNGSQFYSLESYDSALKDSSPFAKWYDEGRLGAIPTIHYHEISEAIKAVI